MLVVNANSNAAVTAGLDAALSSFRFSGGPEITCVTHAEGPHGFESRRDADSVIAPLLRLGAARREARAVVVACFSDPGAPGLREALSISAFGIRESAAAAQARRRPPPEPAPSRAGETRRRRGVGRLGRRVELAPWVVQRTGADGGEPEPAGAAACAP